MQNIFIYLLTFVGATLGILSSLYIAVSLIGVLGYKVYRKVRYGMSLND